MLFLCLCSTTDGKGGSYEAGKIYDNIDPAATYACYFRVLTDEETEALKGAPKEPSKPQYLEPAPQASDDSEDFLKCFRIG